MIPDKYLPLGTVVLLKDGKKRLMITGFYVKSADNKIYDYCSCLYPEGYLSSDKCFMFNHDQIDRIIYFGLSDEEDKTYKNNLKGLINKEENNG